MSTSPCTEYGSPGVDLGVLSRSMELNSAGLDGSSLGPDSPVVRKFAGLS
jgi:hypothetical protein